MINYGYGVMLDAIDQGHLAKLKLWRNDPKVYEWCRQNTLISYDDQIEWFHRQRDDPSIRMFLVRTGHEIVGVAGLTDIDLINRRAEFSMYIGPEHQGQRYAKPALKTLFHYGFNTMGLNRIWGETFEGNRALGIFKAMGMEVEGERKEFYFKNGHYINCTLVSISGDEFRYRYTNKQNSDTAKAKG